MGRMQEMRPPSAANVENFLAIQDPSGQVEIGAAMVDQRGIPISANAPTVRTTLIVRHAWEIGRHDVDVIGLRPDDDPIRPPGDATLPCDEALSWFRDRQHAETNHQPKRAKRPKKDFGKNKRRKKR